MENNSQAIEIKGIVRNQTKIGVQDGQCDDIVNLRFKDGSWRVADDGKSVYNMTGSYSQLYVHTNVYHHLLGVKDGKLYWFANIESDGETFVNLDDPVEICDIEGGVTIVQNGHLLTIISTATTDTTPLPLATSREDVVKYAIFKTGTNEYKVLKVDQNGEQTDRGLHPFGRVHFNTVSSDSDEYSVSIKEWGDATFLTPYESNSYAIEKLAEKGLVSMPFLAIAAIKDYDGNYILASNPQYIFPKEKYYYLQEEGKSIAITYKYTEEPYDGKLLVKIDKVGICDWSNAQKDENVEGALVIDCDKNPSYFQELSGAIPPMNILMNTAPLIGEQGAVDRFYFGSKLTLSIDDFDFIIDNNDVFKSLCIFVTRQVNVFPNSYDDLSEVEKDYDAGERYVIKKNNTYGNCSYKNVRSKKYVIDDLINSPFYLLREYDGNSILTLKNNPIINLDDPKYKDVLRPDVLIQRDTIGGIAFDRKSFCPKVAYMYNQKLHIANYKTIQFNGYPIDCFQLSNHSVKVKSGSYAVGGVLPNLEDGADVQYPRDKFYFIGDIKDVQQYVDKSLEYGYFFAAITVSLETSQGEQKVVRYIKPYRADEFNDGDRANFVESLSPLITFPDYRAKQMTISFVRAASESSILLKTATYQLTPHPYLNFAYYINPDLKPLSTFATKGTTLESFLSGEYSNYYTPTTEQNNTEEYPNGLKVSAVNNPFTFPNASTYQVGSSEIVALMSNAVAIGTGQTGAAPLYVFCKDGVYALVVDSTGEMTYSNARIVARDVCNNAKSVTPIDNGVVFTTDRGIMSIAGSEVVEIGSAAEGDVFDITDTSDKAKKIMFNAFTMPQLAEFPQSLIDNTDFLTYLKGAIVNYNHNERELMVSNPSKDYTYVMDRNGNWSRRAFTAQEYVNNYPTSYRIDKAGNFYKVDADDNDTNKVYLLSNVIKLGTIAFKQAYRLVVRGYFEVINNITTILDKRFQRYYEVDEKGYYYQVIEEYNARSGGEYEFKLSKVKSISTFNNSKDEISLNEGNKFYVRIKDKDGNVLISTNQIIESDDVSFKFALSKPTKLQIELVGIGEFFGREPYHYTYTTISCEDITIIPADKNKLGLYVFGSYDGRQWSLHGSNEKEGKFTDIGCKISHTDIRFLRVCIAGKLSKDTRIDYIEVSADGSALNGKLR